MLKLLQAVAIIILGGVLTACKTELYTDLDEREVNEMFAILDTNGIEAMKISGKDQKATLSVDEKNVARAIDVLTRSGYPKEHFDTVAELFPKDGLIASPVEENARLIYSKSQELAESISQIDGVLLARVHVVFPQKSDRNNVGAPASASVFIKHLDEVSFERFIPKIKLMVSNSIADLNYDKISVVLFPSAIVKPISSQQKFASFLGFKVAKDSKSAITFLFVFILLLIIAGPVVVFFLFRNTKLFANVERIKGE